MEFNDIINENDEVVGKIPYRELYKKLPPHRIVHILIFTKDGKMLLQKRSATKSFCPLHWCTAAGGHVQSGESYEQGAAREFEEELGIKIPLRFLFKTRYDDPRGFFKMLGVFAAEYGGPFQLNKDEVDSVQEFSKNEIEQMMRDKELFHPELKFLLEKHGHQIFL